MFTGPNTIKGEDVVKFYFIILVICGNVHLGVLKVTPQISMSDPVDVSIITELLMAHGVLRACRSGYNSHLDTSIAAILVSCGMSAIIAMAYQV